MTIIYRVLQRSLHFITSACDWGSNAINIITNFASSQKVKMGDQVKTQSLWSCSTESEHFLPFLMLLLQTISGMQGFFTNMQIFTTIIP